MPRVDWRGVTLNRRTARMMTEVQSQVKFRIRPTQGSYSRSVGASAGTHDGGGAIDISVNGLTQRQIVRMVRKMRTVGFAAWYRPPLPGVWGAHVHGIAIGTRDLAPIAARQVIAYRNGRDGLRGNRVDIHARLGVAPTTWEKYRAHRDRAERRV